MDGIKRIISARDDAVPCRKVKASLDPPWFNKNILYLKNKCRKEYLKSKVSRCNVKYQETRRILQSTRQRRTFSLTLYIINISTKDKTKIGYVKFKTKGKHNSVPALQTKNCEITDSLQKANALNDYFKSVFNTETYPIPTVPPVHTGETAPCLNSIFISKVGIAKLITDLNPHKSAGPDNIPARLLKLSPEKLKLSIAI